MSQDKFWDQWGSGGAGAKPGEPPAPSLTGTDKSGTVDDDVLAAWLKSLPPDDVLVPPTPAAPKGLSAFDTSWPPAAPADPFASLSESAPAPGAGWESVVPQVPASPMAAPTSLGEFELNLGSVAGPPPSAPAPVPPSAGIPAPPMSPPAAYGAAAPPPPPAPAPPPLPVAASPFGPPPPPEQPPAEALSAPPLRLEITVGRRTFNQDVQGEALIGRPDAARGLHPEIDLRSDDAVSRRHAKIFVRNGRYVLTDLNSTNGTRHNREWLKPEVEIPLKAGDEIEVGELTVMRVIESPESDAEA